MSARALALGITGASGAIYGVRMLSYLLRSPDVGEVHLVVTDSGYQVLREELQLTRGTLLAEIERTSGVDVAKVKLHPNADIGATLASGSSAPAGMAIVPCSMGTLGAIASGLSTTLLRRAADVMLKERRPLVLVPREAPMSLVHVENMRKLLLAGAHVVPAAPGFYHHPKTIEELVDQIVAKVLDLLDVPHAIKARYAPARSGR